jgi:hypothetical protein
MKFNWRVIAAAVAFAASGAAVAQSSLTRMGPGNNGSMTFLGLDAVSGVSILMDLSYNINDFLPTLAINNPNTTIQWDFRNNTLKVNGATQSGTFRWDNPFSAFDDAATGSVQWAVISGDSQSGQRYLTTGSPTQNQLDTLSLQLSSGMGIANNLYAANESLGTHNLTNFPDTTAGGSFVTSSNNNAYVGGSNFGTQGRWGNNLTWNAFSTEGQSNRFQFINVAPRTTGSQQPTITTYGFPNINNVVATGPVSVFTYDDGVLTWTTPVPEPSTYAMLLAGLAVVGFVARRRQRA